MEAIASQTLLVCVKLPMADSVNKRLRGYLCLISPFYVTDHEVILVHTRAEGTMSSPGPCTETPLCLFLFALATRQLKKALGGDRPLS